MLLTHMAMRIIKKKKLKTFSKDTNIAHIAILVHLGNFVLVHFKLISGLF